MRAVGLPYLKCLPIIDGILSCLSNCIDVNVPVSCQNAIRTMIVCKIGGIDDNPNGNPDMEWSECGNRFSYKQSIPGLIAEAISAINISCRYSCTNIIFANTYQNQVCKTIDYWFDEPIPDNSVQVKAVIFHKGRLTNTEKLTDIVSTWVSLVDIDDYHHFFILNSKLQQYLTNNTPITIDLLLQEKVEHFNNLFMYGTQFEQHLYITKYPID